MIAILGGGITGIAAAIELKKRGKDFVLIEKSARLGGKIHSDQVEGYHLEFGPNTVLINHPETKAFLEYLGLYEQRIEPDARAIKRRFVLKRGKPQAIPYNFGSLFRSKLIGASTLLSILKEPFKVPIEKEEEAEESLADFSKRRFGKQIYEDLITPFVSGIYAGDPEKMSLKYTMPILAQAEAKFGSVLKGMPKLIREKRETQASLNMPKQKIFSFEGGLQVMIEAAEEKIKASIKLKTEVISIKKHNGSYEIRLNENGRESTIEVEQLISTIPAHVLAEKLEFENDLPTAIKKINYVPAVVTHLAFSPSQWKFNRAVFGLLGRKTENVPWLGILFNSEFFPQQQKKNDILLTIISGGYRQPDLLNLSDKEILQQLNRSINLIGLAEGEAIFHHIYRWEKAIPQYEVGYEKVAGEIERFSEANPHFKIAGNYYKGVSVSDCIANGTNLAGEI